MPTPETKQRDVLCVGLAVADTFGKSIDDVPAWDHLGTFDHLEQHVGGCAVNTAIDLARLGMRAGVAACVGNDGNGAFVREELQRDGVDVEGLVAIAGVATAYTFVMIHSTGKRRYLHHLGANARLTDSHIPDALLAQSRLLHIGGTCLMPALDGQPTARLLQRARQLGTLTCMDTAFNPTVTARALIEPCLPHLDIFIPSIEEAQAITGELQPERMMDWMAAYRIPICGIKLGEAGCLLQSGCERIHVPADPVTVVDGSGAGDAFMAGFIYGHLQGWGLEKCSHFATATAAHAIQAIGCSSGVPPAEQVLRYLANRVCSCS
jgi:sugar/nucleoside kinase (ribokinase family)